MSSQNIMSSKEGSNNPVKGQ